MAERDDSKILPDGKLIHSLVGENKCTPSNEAIIQMLSPKTDPNTSDAKEEDSQ